MAVCGLRTILLIVCVLELIITIQRQVFDFLGYLWLPIIANFTNILLIIFGSFGAVQYVTNYLIAYAIWSFIWLTWNVFLLCHFSNVGTLNKENGLLSLGTDSVSWWETNGWGCQPQWGEGDGPGSTWRPTQVDGCLLQWDHVELAQSALGALLAAIALPLAILLAFKSFKERKPQADKSTLPRRPVYTIELSPTEATPTENSLKPMTPRRVKRRSGSRGNNSSVRRSRRSYRNAAYMSSNASLPRDPRSSRPTSAHSSYSNFHAARPASYHTVERERSAPENYEQQPVSESVPIVTNRHTLSRRNSVKSGYDVVGPYKEAEPQVNDASNIPCGDLTARIDNIARDWAESHEGAWHEPPPPAPPYSARDTPPPAPPYTGRNTPPTYQSQYAPYYLPGQQYNQNVPSPVQHSAQAMQQQPSTQPIHQDHTQPMQQIHNTQPIQQSHSHSTQADQQGHSYNTHPIQKDNSHSTQSVQQSHTHNIQPVPQGHTHNIQPVPQGHTHNIQPVPQGHTHNIQPVPQGHTHNTQHDQQGHSYNSQPVQQGHIHSSQPVQQGHNHNNPQQGPSHSNPQQGHSHSNPQQGHSHSNPQQGHSNSTQPMHQSHIQSHHQSPQYENHAAYDYHNRYGHGTPVSPGPPAYHAINEIYTNMPPCQ